MGRIVLDDLGSILDNEVEVRNGRCDRERDVTSVTSHVDDDAVFR